MNLLQTFDFLWMSCTARLRQIHNESKWSSDDSLKVSHLTESIYNSSVQRASAGSRSVYFTLTD